MPYGRPLYRRGQRVGFNQVLSDAEEPTTMRGTVFIVDPRGTFEQNTEASYDIMVEDFPEAGQQCLFKHLVESTVFPLEEDA